MFLKLGPHLVETDNLRVVEHRDEEWVDLYYIGAPDTITLLGVTQQDIDSFHTGTFWQPGGTIQIVVPNIVPSDSTTSGWRTGEVVCDTNFADQPETADPASDEERTLDEVYG